MPGATTSWWLRTAPAACRRARRVFPENSLAAARNAIELGAEMIEVDVQKSRDGAYVVFHDSWLDRTSTCKGRLLERTLAELKTCRLVVEGTGAVTDESVPTLARLLAVTRNRIFVNIDNKLDLAELPGIVAVARDHGHGRSARDQAEPVESGRRWRRRRP